MIEKTLFWWTDSILTIIKVRSIRGDFLSSSFLTLICTSWYILSYSLFVCVFVSVSMCVCVCACMFVCIFYFLSMNDLISAVQICHLTILYGSVFLSIPHTLRQWNINNQILTIQNTKNVALKNFHKSLFRIGERVQDLSAHPVVRSGGRNSWSYV